MESLADPGKAIVLPFKIYSKVNRSYLGGKIEGTIEKNLKQDGIEIIKLESLSPDLLEDTNKHLKDLRKAAKNKNARYIIWGSMTWIANKYSIDVRLAKSEGADVPIGLYMEGRGIESLPKTIQTLTKDLSAKIFKKEKVAKVIITGNKRIEADAIKKHITTVPGDIFLAKSLSKDLKSIYAMGYFEDIRIESEDGYHGKTINFIVKEKPTIRNIILSGNKVFKDEEITSSLDLKTGAILNVFKIRNNINLIKDLYREKNYHNVEVTYKVQELKNNQGDLELFIEEGEKILIKTITFEGNSAIDAKKLKGIMKTSKKGFFSWLTSSGDLNKEDLKQDIMKLQAFYHNSGYIQARIGDPGIEYKDNWIYITIKIDEGPRFKMGSIDISGDLILDLKKIEAKIMLNKEEYFNREVLRKDILMLTDIYLNKGYAYARVLPDLDKNIEKLIVNVDYKIKKGKKIYFDEIIISGNTKTRDKVIRRELKVYEQGLFNNRKLKESMRRLSRLDYFEDLSVDTVKGDSDEKMILKIDVKDKSTGSFNVGGGYNSEEKGFFMGSISQRNLFGRGQILKFDAQIGKTTNRFILNFTEPWLFDIPLSAGIDIFNWEKDYDSYDKKSTGGGLRFGYKLFDYTRAYLSYSYDIAHVDNIDDDASVSIKELEGDNTTNSIRASLRYDSRDHLFNPSEGQNHNISVEYAGFGGDITFIKYLGEGSIYIPLFFDIVGSLHAEGGYAQKHSDGLLPDYELFYLGGMNSLRGFDYRDIHLTDEDGAEVGGQKYVQFNAELILPLLKDAGVVGVVFYDTGNVYGKDENIDFSEVRQSTGFGIRWFSPMGPIRLENGYILDRKEGEKSGGDWEFSIGAAF